MPEEDAHSKRSELLQVYLKLIDYKRSIGATQWTVLSVFTTASGAVAVFAIGRDSSPVVGISLLFGVGLYWLGFMLYRRYRAYNRRVCDYLVELEEQIGIGFQKHVDSFHQRGFSTERILAFGGVLYFLFSLAVFVMSLLGLVQQKR